MRFSFFALFVWGIVKSRHLTMGHDASLGGCAGTPFALKRLSNNGGESRAKKRKREERAF